MAKDTLQNSFYALNGTLIMYIALGFSAAARGTVVHLNVKGITDNIFENHRSCGSVLCFRRRSSTAHSNPIN
jgi:hypothetical protein